MEEGEKKGRLSKERRYCFIKQTVAAQNPRLMSSGGKSLKLELPKLDVDGAGISTAD